MSALRRILFVVLALVFLADVLAYGATLSVARTPQTSTSCSSGNFVYGPFTLAANVTLLTVEASCTDSVGFSECGWSVSDDHSGSTNWVLGASKASANINTDEFYQLAPPTGVPITITVTHSAASAGTCSAVAYSEVYAGTVTTCNGATCGGTNGGNTNTAPTVGLGTVTGYLAIMTGAQFDTANAISGGPTNSYTELADPANPSKLVPFDAYNLSTTSNVGTAWTTTNSALWNTTGEWFAPGPTATATATATATSTATATATATSTPVTNYSMMNRKRVQTNLNGSDL